MTNSVKTITREKHLDHMVKVVPFIVCAYAIQCYFISSVEPEIFAINGHIFLGACLVAMIAGFVTYDLTHIVKLEETHLSVKIEWLRYSKTYAYSDIKESYVSEAAQSFTTLSIIMNDGRKIKIYFVDHADKLKSMLDQKKIDGCEFESAA